MTFGKPFSSSSLTIQQRHSKLYILSSIRHKKQFDIYENMFWVCLKFDPKLIHAWHLLGRGILPKILSKYFPTCSDFKTTINLISSKFQLWGYTLHLKTKGFHISFWYHTQSHHLFKTYFKWAWYVFWIHNLQHHTTDS